MVCNVYFLGEGALLEVAMKMVFGQGVGEHLLQSLLLHTFYVSDPVANILSNSVHFDAISILLVQIKFPLQS